MHCALLILPTELGEMPDDVWTVPFLAFSLRGVLTLGGLAAGFSGSIPPPALILTLHLESVEEGVD